MLRSLAAKTWSRVTQGGAPRPLLAFNAPLAAFNSQLTFASRTMKVMQTLKKRCEHCYIVKRGNLRYVSCKVNPRHKARNGPKVRAGWLRKRAYA